MYNNFPVNNIDEYEVDTPTFWNDIYKEGIPAWGEQPADVLYKFIECFPKNASILDLGCGIGRNSIYLGDLGYNVTGIDLSIAAITKAKAMESKCTFVCADIFHYKINKKFDVVLDFGLYHFMPTEYKTRYINSIDNALKLGGIYCNQSGRLTNNPIKGGVYTPPQLTKKELQDPFAKYKIELIEEDTLPPYKIYGEYPCWNLIARKQ